MITSLLIVPFFIKGVATGGTGLALEATLVAAGLLVGLLAASRMEVYLSPKTGRAATRAGLAYALVWIVVIGARVAFSYGSSHWFASPLGRWMVGHHVSSDALTDALIFMALAMVLTRVAAMAVRTRAVSGAVGATAALAAEPVETSPAGDGRRRPGRSAPAVASSIGRGVGMAARVVLERRQQREDDRARRRADRRGRRDG